MNGNGRRESSEPGFAGVMLRRGADLAVTDNRGSFVLMGNEREPYELDARSLPFGWIASPLVVPAETRVIGALSVAPLEVELALDPADTARVSAATSPTSSSRCGLDRSRVGVASSLGYDRSSSTRFHRAHTP